jgi:LmbE family N-acetylglucosaminyl deacetylase
MIDPSPSRAALERLFPRSGDTADVVSTAVVVAHPDDEVVGAGGRLPYLPGITVIHTTDGAPRDMRDALAHGFATREDYAQARRRELLAALELAGIPPERTRSLEVVDQEASLHMLELARRLADVLDDLRPEVVLTHPYEGGHPDHDATAFAVHAACGLLRRDGAGPGSILELCSYHDHDGAMAVFEFLPGDTPIVTVPLEPPVRALKARMIDRFTTQKKVLEPFPIELERFRPAPRYDFTRPPHGGQLFYERFPWGMDGARWRAAAAALEALKVPARSVARRSPCR